MLLSACATYYQKLAIFNNDFESGNLVKANDFLTKDKKGQTGKNQLLYHFNKGTIEHLLGNYTESNISNLTKQTCSLKTIRKK